MHINHRLLFAQIITFFLFCASTQYTYAQGGGTLSDCATLATSGTILQWPHCTILVLGQLIITVINAALIFGSILLLFNLFKAAFDYITAGDDTKKIESSRSNITWSIVGIIGLGSVFILFDYILELIPGLDTLLNYGTFN